MSDWGYANRLGTKQLSNELPHIQNLMKSRGGIADPWQGVVDSGNGAGTTTIPKGRKNKPYPFLTPQRFLVDSRIKCERWNAQTLKNI